MATNQGCRGLVPSARLITRYLYYFLTHNVDLLNDLGTGTTFKELAAGKLKEIPIPLPPLAEQQRIVAILDEAFADIATARANAVKNLENARALFESHLEAVFSNRGEGWVEKLLEEEVEFSAGYAFKSVNYVTEHIGIRLLRGDNIMQGMFRWDDAVYWPQDESLLFQRFNLAENDIVLAMDRPLVTAGLKIACVSKQDVPCLQVQRTARLRTSINLQWRYLFHLLRSKSFVDYLLEGQTGLGVPHISGKQILSFRFWLPPLAAQTKVVTNLDDLQSETNRLTDIYTQKIAALDALKKSLLYQAFSGAL
jgi:type I restriction enzyme S subunit